MYIISCLECDASFESKSVRRKYCNDLCRSRFRERDRKVPCAHCGEPMERSGKHVQGVSMHLACIRDKTGHGSTRYQSGCRRDVCLAAGREYLRAWRAAYREKNGESANAVSRRRFMEKHGHAPENYGTWISTAARLALYERDEWSCLLCGSPVDVEAHWNDNLAPSLDHILPRSLGGTHDPENLRTAHRSCNSARGVTVDP